MRACSKWYKHPVVGVLAVVLIACTGVAQGQEIEWVPVSSTGPFSLGPNQITIPGGAAVRVNVDLFINGWGMAPGAPRLGAYNATLLGTSLLGANASPANAGVDFGTPAQDPCATAADCPSGQCGVFEENFCDDFQPGFSVINVCLSDPNKPCNSAQAAAICGSPVCISNSAFVLASCPNVVAVSLPVSKDYEWIGACQSGGITDDTTNKYAGTLRLDVPANAKGTYTLRWNPDAEKSFLNDENAIRIPGLMLIDGLVTIQTGRCCFGLGTPGEGCADNLTSTECNARPGPRLFEPNVLCPQSGGPDCAQCLTTAPNPCQDPAPGQAGNDNLCTSNTCVPFVPGGVAGNCVNAPLYNTATQCCDPDAGVPAGLTPIDDFDVCTEDTCDPNTGDVSHDPAGAAGESCSDGLGCTIDDACDGTNSAANGGCVGDDVNTFNCVDDGDCPVGTCDTETGFCSCSEDTPLCIDILGKVCEGTTTPCQEDADCGPQGNCVGTHLPDGNCFDIGQTVSAAVAMGAGSAFVTGGQFLIEYDPTCLDLDAASVGPCAGSIFTNVIDVAVDETAGTIWYAATVDPAAPVGTRGPANIMCMNFTKKAGCDECDICFASVNPKNTILTNDSGNTVPLLSCGCSKPVRQNGEIDLDTPDGEESNSDCNFRTADITWPAPSASDTCDGPLGVVCVGASSFGEVDQATVNGLVLTGGEFPQGDYFFLCSASNSCGDVVRDVWTVSVSDQQSIDVEVHLSPTMNPGVFERAITFELWDDCGADPTKTCEVLSFGGPLNFRAHARTSLKIPKGNYLCITAQDCLHTLRAAADIECDPDTGRWSATWKGDPLLGGNWLVGGNLDACKEGVEFGAANTIDIRDFGVFMSEIAAGASYPFPGNTDCDTEWPHGDVNADGAVDNLDYNFILSNFLKVSKSACCPDPGAAPIVPLEEITVKELRRQGLNALTVGDLNGDGLLNVDDMAAYMQGVVPDSSRAIRKGTSSRR